MITKLERNAPRSLLNLKCKKEKKRKKVTRPKSLELNERD